MRTAIEALLALGIPVNPPLSAIGLDDLARRLHTPLPPPIRDLYCAFDGQPESPPVPRYPMRLMPATEAIAMNELLLAHAESLSPAAGVRYFWTDDNSNWAGVFVTGPLTGTVHVLDHDEPDEVPRYRSVATFLPAHVDAFRTNTCWFDMPTDYPSPADLDPDLHAFDTALTSSLRVELSRTHDERAALAILHVAPANETNELVAFLDADTLAVRTAACRAMGRRDHAAAISKLAAIAGEDVPSNPVIEALIALNQMTDPRARIVLRELRATADPGLADYFPVD